MRRHPDGSRNVMTPCGSERLGGHPGRGLPPSARLPLASGLFIRHGLDGGDHVLKLGNLTQGATGGHPVVPSHREDEIALVGFEAVEKSGELVVHQVAVVVGITLNNRVSSLCS